MPGVTTSISKAATRPPPIFGSSCWQRMPMIAVGKLRANLFLLVGREDVDDAVDRAVRRSMVCSVPNTMWPVSAARDGRFDRFQVAHFADQDHVRVLPQRAANRLGERRHVDADLALVDRRLLVLVLKLDRVFDRDDVMVDVLVEVVDHAGQRWCVLPEPVGPVTRNSPRGRMIRLLTDWRQPELLHASAS